MNIRLTCSITLRAEAQKLLRLAARALKAKGIGRRDAGELLGASFQRVQQLVDE